MRRKLVLAVLICLVAAVAVSHRAAPASSFTFRDNPATGKVVASNDRVTLVWGYLPLPGEGNSCSGGSLYGLWDKARDPSCSRNLIQTLKASDPVSGYSTPSRAGVGGFGATKVDVLGSSKAISEIGLRGTLLDHSVGVDAAGNLHAEFTFVVSGPGHAPMYQVTKQWTVTPGGTINLRAKWLWLTTAAADDPCYNFAVSRNCGWQRVGWYSHDGTACLGPGSDGWSIPNRWTYDDTLATEGDCNYPTYHAQQVTFDKSPSAGPLTIAIGVGRGGYESSGLFGLGWHTWSRWDAAHGGMPPEEQITGEFSNYRTAAYGHEVRWGAWYSDNGGRLTAPDMPSRFQLIYAGTSWDDYFTVTLGD